MNTIPNAFDTMTSEVNHLLIGYYRVIYSFTFGVNTFPEFSSEELHTGNWEDEPK